MFPPNLVANEVVEITPIRAYAMVSGTEAFTLKQAYTHRARTELRESSPETRCARGPTPAPPGTEAPLRVAAPEQDRLGAGVQCGTAGGGDADEKHNASSCGRPGQKKRTGTPYSGP